MRPLTPALAAATLALSAPAWAGSVELYLTANRATISAADPTVTLTLWAHLLTPGPQDIGFATVRPAALTTTNGEGGALAVSPGLMAAFIATQTWSQGFSSNGTANNAGSPSIGGVSAYQDAPDLFGLGQYVNGNFNGSLDIAVYKFQYTATDFTPRTVGFGISAPVNNYIAAIYTSAHGATRNIRFDDATYSGTNVNVIDAPTIPLPGAAAMGLAGLGLLGAVRRRR